MSSKPEPPTFAELVADPEIAALLDFEPVPRAYTRKDSWTPALQRELIARLAVHGSVGKASEEMSRDRGGARRLYKAADATSFRAAWDSAVSLAVEREAERHAMQFLPPDTIPPSIRQMRKASAPAEPDECPGLLPGQVWNEYGEPEDEAYFRERGENAMPSICTKLLAIRRLFLRDISGCAGKRAAFEILTELPIDWELAKTLGPQADEPWHNANQRKPDMILAAETGWTFGHEGYGPDRTAQARRHIDEYLAEQGMEPVVWDAPSEDGAPAKAGA